MVVISSLYFDIAGSLIIRRLDTDTQFDDGARRVTRTATLDGGAVTYDGGFSPADRILVVGASPFTHAMLERARDLIQNHSRLVVTCRSGGYECSGESYSVSDTTLTLRFLVLKDLTTTT